MVRKIIVVVVSALILIGGITAFRKLADSKKPPERKTEKRVSTVFTKTVENGNVPIQLSATGSLTALNRTELFAEVQGVMLPDNGKFKPGTRFNRGDLLVSVRSTDFEATLKSQKSNLQNLITAALPDLKLDYPDAFSNWSQYLESLDIEKPLPELPKTASNKEKMFITGRNIYTTYYNIKNAELVLNKYRLSAPFNGVLTQALVNPGTVIRPGQKLGEFIDPTVFEMKTPIPSSMIHHLKIGQSVQLHSTEPLEHGWVGVVSRINSEVDGSTQSTDVYIKVDGDGFLKEGMFLEATIDATEIEDVFEIERSVLFDSDQVYIAGDSVLVQKTVEPIYFNENTVVVRGLKNGDEVLTKMAPGAYPGMRISIYQEK